MLKSSQICQEEDDLKLWNVHAVHSVVFNTVDRLLSCFVNSFKKEFWNLVFEILYCCYYCWTLKKSPPLPILFMETRTNQTKQDLVSRLGDLCKPEILLNIHCLASLVSRCIVLQFITNFLSTSFNQHSKLNEYYAIIAWLSWW